MLHLGRITAPANWSVLFPGAGASQLRPTWGNLWGHEPPQGSNSLPWCQLAPKVLYNLLVAPRKGAAPQGPKALVAPPFGAQVGGQAGKPGSCQQTPKLSPARTAPLPHSSSGSADRSHLQSSLQHMALWEDRSVNPTSPVTERLVCASASSGVKSGQ